MNGIPNDEKTKYHINFDYRPSTLRLGDVHIVQIGRRFTEVGAVIEKHAHLNWFELTIVTNGSCTVVTNGEESSATVGDIHLSYPCDIHEIRADRKCELEYDFFAFYIDGAMRDDFERLTRDHIGGGSRIFRDEHVAYLVRTAISEFVTEKPYGKVVIESIAKQILAYVIRDFDRTVPVSSSSTKADVLCQQIMAYIDTHIHSIQNLTEIAEVFNYNYSYLSSLFKKNTKRTLADYCSGRRLETARALLSSEGAKIVDVSETLGYSSPYAFSNAFKQRYGVCPKSIKASRSSCGKPDTKSISVK